MLIKWNSILFKSYIRKDSIEDFQVIFSNIIIDIQLL